METGGEHCGVVQISAEIFRIVAGTNEVSREAAYFNKYIKPPDSTIWTQHATEVHELYAEYNHITSADPIEVVWNQLEIFLDKIIGQHQCGILVA